VYETPDPAGVAGVAEFHQMLPLSIIHAIYRACGALNAPTEDGEEPPQQTP